MMVLSFSPVDAAVAMVTRFSVLGALLDIMKEIVRILDSSDNRAHNLLKYLLLEAYILKYRYIHAHIYTVFGVCLVCPVRMHAHSAGISS